ncbi:MAG: hypothetical protein LIO67_06610 [Lachnospiraceae bacterium]|nr:hypothetical protein [Lachnospiraceae bacterium]
MVFFLYDVDTHTDDVKEIRQATQEEYEYVLEDLQIGHRRKKPEMQYSFSTPWGKLYRSAIAKKILFPKDAFIWEDAMYNFIFLDSISNDRFYIVDYCAYYWRGRETSATHTFRPKCKSELLTVFEIWRKTIENTSSSGRRKQLYYNTVLDAISVYFDLFLFHKGNRQKKAEKIASLIEFSKEFSLNEAIDKCDMSVWSSNELCMLQMFKDKKFHKIYKKYNVRVIKCRIKLGLKKTVKSMMSTMQEPQNSIKLRIRKWLFYKEKANKFI